MDKKNRAVCQRLAYEIPLACLLAPFVSWKLRDGLSQGRYYGPLVEYSERDVLLIALPIALVVSLALFILSRPKSKHVWGYLVFYPALVVFCYLMLMPVYSQTKVVA